MIMAVGVEVRLSEGVCKAGGEKKKGERKREFRGKKRVKLVEDEEGFS